MESEGSRILEVERSPNGQNSGEREKNVFFYTKCIVIVTSLLSLLSLPIYKKSLCMVEQPPGAGLEEKVGITTVYLGNSNFSLRIKKKYPT